MLFKQHWDFNKETVLDFPRFINGFSYHKKQTDVFETGEP